MNQPAPPADRRVPYGSHPSQFVDFRFPAAGAAPALAVMIHGGFWRARFDLAHAGHPCAGLTAAGFTTANLEYRRVGEDGGGWPGTRADVRRAVAFARHYTGSPPTVLLGHSAGGHLALCMAAEMADLCGVVALAPVSDPRRAWELGLGSGAAAEFFGGSPEEFPERYAIGRPACPTVLVHGDSDDVVPVELSRGFEGARLVEVPGADHFDVVDPETAVFANVREIALTLLNT
jgi:acetyl esterase/lipase